MARARAHTQMIPAFDYLDTCRVGRYQPDSDTRCFLVRAPPYCEPAQQRDAGRIELVARNQPAVGLHRGGSSRKTPACGCAEFRLDAQMIYERALFDCVAKNPFDQMTW